MSKQAQEYKHGLSIDVTPTQNLTFPDTKEDIIVTGDAIEVNDCDITQEDKVVSSLLVKKHITIQKTNKEQLVTITLTNSSQLLLTAQKDAHAKIIITNTSSANIASYITIKAEEKSTITCMTISAPSTQAIHWMEKEAILKEYATVHWIDLLFKSSYTRAYLINTFKGKESTGTIKTVYLANRQQIYDIYTASQHYAHHSYSDIVTRGVIADSAKALSRGLVQINKDAYQSNGYEQQDALLLSDESEADAIPNLEIHNHDVKCSHGSTVGRIDQEKLFYLMSRGLSERDAKAHIIQGYFSVLLDQLEQEEIKKQIQQVIQEAVE